MGANQIIPKGLLLAALLAGCAAEVDPKVASKSEVPATGGNVDVFNLSRPSEDASNLTISELTVSQMRVKGVIVPSLYVTTSGLADNVEIMACYDKMIQNNDGSKSPQLTCEPTRNETVTRLVFAPFPAAQIAFKARACVLPERAASPGVLCGPWKETSWAQPANTNSAMVDLLARRERYRAEIAEFSNNIKEALVQFEKETEACVKRKDGHRNVAKVKNIVSNFMQLGTHLISKALEPGNVTSQGVSLPPTENKEQPIPAVNTQGTIASVAQNASKIDIKEQPELSTAAKNLTESPESKPNASLSLVGSGASVGALQTLGTAVLDIATATTTAEANRKCYAQENTESQVAGAKERLEELRAKLQEVETQIQAAGGGQ